MKDMEKYYRNISVNWSAPLLGLLTAHWWFKGALESPAWWILIVVCVLMGNWKRS